MHGGVLTPNMVELADEVRQRFAFSAEVHSFLLHRLRLLEQALLVEQGLFSIALATLSDTDREPNLPQVMGLTSRLSLSLASKGPHKHISLPPQSRIADAVRHAVKELHLLLEDLYADLPGLPAVLTCDGLDYAHPRFLSVNKPTSSSARTVPTPPPTSRDNYSHSQFSSLLPAVHSNAPSDKTPVEGVTNSSRSSEGRGATSSAPLDRRMMIGSPSAPQGFGAQTGPLAVAVVSPFLQSSQTTRDHIPTQQAN
ncbi:unnamed protein product, partial [Dibothriocephalus latus]